METMGVLVEYFSPEKKLFWHESVVSTQALRELFNVLSQLITNLLCQMPLGDKYNDGWALCD